MKHGPIAPIPTSNRNPMMLTDKEQESVRNGLILIFAGFVGLILLGIITN